MVTRCHSFAAASVTPLSCSHPPPRHVSCVTCHASWDILMTPHLLPHNQHSQVTSLQPITKAHSLMVTACYVRYVSSIELHNNESTKYKAHKACQQCFYTIQLKLAVQKPNKRKQHYWKYPPALGWDPTVLALCLQNMFMLLNQAIFENIGGCMAVTFAADIIVFQNDVSLPDQNIFYHQIFPRLMTRRARLYISTYKSLNEI